MSPRDPILSKPSADIGISLIFYISVYTRILVESHISRPLKFSVKMMIFDKCNNVIIVMCV